MQKIKNKIKKDEREENGYVESEVFKNEGKKGPEEKAREERGGRGIGEG